MALIFSGHCMWINQPFVTAFVIELLTRKNKLIVQKGDLVTAKNGFGKGKGVREWG